MCNVPTDIRPAILAVISCVASFTVHADGAVSPSQAAHAYEEAAILASLVASGELPPVDERLPVAPYQAHIPNVDDASVFTPVPTSEAFFDRNRAPLAYLDSTAMKPFSALAESWEFSADFREVTIRLREGVKWSDGNPFVAEHIKFAHTHVIMNDSIFPEPLPYWKGSSIELIDDLTVKFIFPDPKPRFIHDHALDVNRPNNYSKIPLYLPSHRADHFLAALRSNPPKGTSIAQHNSWEQYFLTIAPDTALGVPTLSPWVVTEVAEDYMMAERNPYFWAIDSEKNQLPYFNRLWLPPQTQDAVDWPASPVRVPDPLMTVPQVFDPLASPVDSSDIPLLAYRSLNAYEMVTLREALPNIFQDWQTLQLGRDEFGPQVIGLYDEDVRRIGEIYVMSTTRPLQYDELEELRGRVLSFSSAVDAVRHGVPPAHNLNMATLLDHAEICNLTVYGVPDYYYPKEKDCLHDCKLLDHSSPATGDPIALKHWVMWARDKYESKVSGDWAYDLTGEPVGEVTERNMRLSILGAGSYCE